MFWNGARHENGARHVHYVMVCFRKTEYSVQILYIDQYIIYWYACGVKGCNDPG
jgi:hypothetical protein